MVELDDKKRALLHKLRSLAERGIGGERENAQRMLEKKLEEFGIDPEDFELNEDVGDLWFKVPKYSKMFVLIAAEVLDVDTIRYTKAKSGKEIGIRCTASQAVEIELIYAAYRRGLDKEIEMLKEAYFYRNNLYSTATRSFDEKFGRDRTLKIQQMADRMARTFVHKQIEE